MASEDMALKTIGQHTISNGINEQETLPTDDDVDDDDKVRFYNLHNVHAYSNIVSKYVSRDIYIRRQNHKETPQRRRVAFMTVQTDESSAAS